MHVCVPYVVSLKRPCVCEGDVYVSEPLLVNVARGEGDKQSPKFFEAIDSLCATIFYVGPICKVVLNFTYCRLLFIYWMQKIFAPRTNFFLRNRGDSMAADLTIYDLL